MKKTLRKAFILLAVITVMMVCAFVLPASAEGCHGTIDSWIADEKPATCTEHGYINYYCTCGELAYTTKDEVPDPRFEATGHRYLVTDYVLSDDGTYYTRIVQCQNPVCARASGSTPAVVGTVRECPTKYYLVEFKNETASPAIGDVENHADYFLEGYYVEDNVSSWVVDRKGNEEGKDYAEDYITKSYAPISRVVNDPGQADFGDYITEPDFEYFEEDDGTVSLFVKENAVAYADGKSAYKGVIPVRNNDTEKGGYEFTTWKSEGEDISVKKIIKNTVFYAEFEAPDDYTVTYTFKNGDTPIFESVHDVKYGSTVVYDAQTPTREKTAEYSYEFAGWRVEDKYATDTENFIELNAPITLYNKHVTIYAQFRAVPNKYTVELVDYKGDAFTYGGQPIRNSVAFFEEIAPKEVRDTLTGAALFRPSNETYVFEQTENWKISAINGYKLTGRDFIVGLDRFSAPSSVTVKVETGEEITLDYNDYAVISVTPVYLSQYILYPVTVSIMHNYFLEEDLFDNTRPRSDILDDFYITVYGIEDDEESKKVLATGQANSEGKITFKLPYSKTWRFEAVTKNGKYYGQTIINTSAIDTDTGEEFYKVVHIKGVGIAPRLSDSWVGGTQQSCSCVCHSFLSGILIRIYNFIYRIFGIEYKCCDDLFAVHGDVLVYPE